MSDVDPGLEATDLPVDLGDAGAADSSIDVPLVPEGFQVTNAGTASWVIRKVLEARKHAANARAWCDREILRARRDEESLLFLFGRQLEDFAAQEIAKLKGRRRSVSLPGGIVGFRAQPPRVVVKDEMVALSWCRRHLPEAVGVRVSATGPVGLALLKVGRSNPDECKVEEGLQVSILASHVGESGEIVPGTDVAPAVDKFYVR